MGSVWDKNDVDDDDFYVDADAEDEKAALAVKEFKVVCSRLSGEAFEGDVVDYQADLYMTHNSPIPV
jgi:hypothetical protein